MYIIWSIQKVNDAITSINGFGLARVNEFWLLKCIFFFKQNHQLNRELPEFKSV